MAWRDRAEETVVRGGEIQVPVLTRTHFPGAVVPIATDPELIRDRQVRIAPAVVGHLCGEAREQFVLDPESKLPLRATFAPSIEKAVAVDIAVRLDSRRNARLSSPALGCLKTDRD